MEKEGNSIDYRDLAERFYELDTEVYETSGSKMGKVFPGSKQVSVKQILQDIENEDTDKLRDELILINNMLMTLEEHESYEEMLREYHALSEDMQAFFADKNLMREQISRDFTDDRYGIMHRGKEDRVVICIARQTGAGGHEIGYRLSERLGISFYDDNIMDMMIEEMEDSYLGIGGKDARYIKQSKLIENIARSKDCVIVGRSCGHVLMINNIPRFSVFIGAPREKRIRRKMLLLNQDRKSTEDMIRKTDRERKSSYNYYTGKKWGHAEDFDLCINSACYGIEGSVDLLEKLVREAINKKE